MHLKLPKFPIDHMIQLKFESSKICLKLSLKHCVLAIANPHCKDKFKHVISVAP